MDKEFDLQKMNPVDRRKLLKILTANKIDPRKLIDANGRFKAKILIKNIKIEKEKRKDTNFLKKNKESIMKLEKLNKHKRHDQILRQLNHEIELEKMKKHNPYQTENLKKVDKNSKKGMKNILKEMFESLKSESEIENPQTLKIEREQLKRGNFSEFENYENDFNKENSKRSNLPANRRQYGTKYYKNASYNANSVKRSPEKIIDYGSSEEGIVSPKKKILNGIENNISFIEKKISRVEKKLNILEQNLPEVANFQERTPINKNINKSVSDLGDFKSPVTVKKVLNDNQMPKLQLNFSNLNESDLVDHLQHKLYENRISSSTNKNYESIESMDSENCEDLNIIDTLISSFKEKNEFETSRDNLKEMEEILEVEEEFSSEQTTVRSKDTQTNLQGLASSNTPIQPERKIRNLTGTEIMINDIESKLAIFEKSRKESNWKDCVKIEEAGSSQEYITPNIFDLNEMQHESSSNQVKSSKREIFESSLDDSFNKVEVKLVSKINSYTPPDLYKQNSLNLKLSHEGMNSSRYVTFDQENNKAIKNENSVNSIVEETFVEKFKSRTSLSDFSIRFPELTKKNLMFRTSKPKKKKNLPMKDLPSCKHPIIKIEKFYRKFSKTKDEITQATDIEPLSPTYYMDISSQEKSCYGEGDSEVDLLSRIIGSKDEFKLKQNTISITIDMIEKKKKLKVSKKVKSNSRRGIKGAIKKKMITRKASYKQSLLSEVLKMGDDEFKNYFKKVKKDSKEDY